MVRGPSIYEIVRWTARHFRNRYLSRPRPPFAPFQSEIVPAWCTASQVSETLLTRAVYEKLYLQVASFTCCKVCLGSLSNTLSFIPQHGTVITQEMAQSWWSTYRHCIHNGHSMYTCSRLAACHPPADQQAFDIE